MREVIPQELAAILASTGELQSAYLVGGCVRDWLLGRPVADFDVEVFDLDLEPLAGALSRWGRTELVGRSYPIVKLTVTSGRTFDFGIARTPGEHGARLTLEQAAARRDFTINAMSWDPRRMHVLDFFGGQDDLRNGILRHTSVAFAEDPLRVLRGMQFAGRFALRTAPETVALCRSIAPIYREVAVERVWGEWCKWATKCVAPSRGLQHLAQCGWIALYPELAALRGTPQDAEWHPEGDVFAHTCHCLDALAELSPWQTADALTRTVLSFAVLTHDFAKPDTTHAVNRGGRMRIVSPGHAEAGGPLASRFLRRIGAPAAIEERVVPLVVNHLAHLQPLTARAVRRLAKRLEPATIQELSTLITADAFGRPPLPKTLPEGLRTLTQLATQAAVATGPPRPILMGRHLLALGMVPGTSFGRILDAAYQAQLEGAFQDLPQALAWLRSRQQTARNGGK